MLGNTERLISLLRAHLTTGEVTRSDWSDLEQIPAGVPIEYLPGVVATRLPVIIPGVSILVMDMEPNTSTGRIVHNCKKRAVCMMGSYTDEVSRVSVVSRPSGKSRNRLTWQANTPHRISTKEKTRILLQFNR